jgi:hypothetical protein
VKINNLNSTNHRSLVWSQLSVDKWWLGRKQLPGSEARGALEFVQSVRKGYNPKEEGREDRVFFFFFFDKCP